MPLYDALADTSVIIPWLRAEPAATQFLEGRRIGICVAALAEIRIGALKSNDSATALERLRWVSYGIPAIHITERTSSVYAKIYVALQTIGRPIPINDIWIAASALEWNVPLIARDAHFSRIEGLIVLSC